MTTDETQSKDIFGDRESMLKVWIDERRSRDFNASLMWENLKFFSGLISAIITVDTFFLKFTLDGSMGSKYTSELTFFSIVLPILVLVLSLCGRNDLRRRWKRTLEAIAHLSKLENLLGLDKSVKEKVHVLAKDNYLFQRFSKSTKNIDSEKDYIYREMNEDNMYTSMKNVYNVLITIGVSLLAYQLYLTYSVFDK
jgi:hypothetical protein